MDYDNMGSCFGEFSFDELECGECLLADECKNATMDMELSKILDEEQRLSDMPYQ